MSIAEQVSLVECPTDNTTEMTRIVAASVIGTAIEWYDFLIYGTASALVFNKLFFPLSDPALGTYMKTHMLVIACSFSARGRHMYPGKAVTDRKYCGIDAAMCKAAIPPFNGPAT